MSLRKLFLEIESGAFAARLNLASGSRLAFWTLDADPALNRLEEELAEDPQKALIVLGRVEQLVRINVDHRYENPHDAALSAYCWVLAKSNRGLGRVAAHLLGSSRQTWWARKVADAVLENFPASTKDTETKTAPAQVEFFEGVAQRELDEDQTASAIYLLASLSTGTGKYSLISALTSASKLSSSSRAEVLGWFQQLSDPVLLPYREHEEHGEYDDEVVEWAY